MTSAEIKIALDKVGCRYKPYLAWADSSQKENLAEKLDEGFEIESFSSGYFTVKKGLMYWKIGPGGVMFQT